LLTARSRFNFPIRSHRVQDPFDPPPLWISPCECFVFSLLGPSFDPNRVLSCQASFHRPVSCRPFPVLPGSRVAIVLPKQFNNQSSRVPNLLPLQSSGAGSALTCVPPLKIFPRERFPQFSNLGTPIVLVSRCECYTFGSFCGAALEHVFLWDGIPFFPNLI